MTRAEFIAHFPNATPDVIKLSCEPDPAPPQFIESEAAEREAELHGQIISWCRTQHPIAPYIHARMDRCSTIGEGVPDFAVCYRGRVILVECKSRVGKMSEAQRNWAHLASLQGCVVHLVRSIEEFLEAVK